jgi:hypothetical protein
LGALGGGLVGFVGSALTVMFSSMGMCGSEAKAYFSNYQNAMDYIITTTSAGVAYGFQFGMALGFASAFAGPTAAVALEQYDAISDYAEASAAFIASPNMCTATWFLIAASDVGDGDATLPLGIDTTPVGIADTFYEATSNPSSQPSNNGNQGNLIGLDVDTETNISCNSFSADTEVSTPDGDVPISEIDIGDTVLAYNRLYREQEKRKI